MWDPKWSDWVSNNVEPITFDHSKNPVTVRFSPNIRFGCSFRDRCLLVLRCLESVWGWIPGEWTPIHQKILSSPLQNTFSSEIQGNSESCNVTASCRLVTPQKVAFGSGRKFTSSTETRFLRNHIGQADKWQFHSYLQTKSCVYFSMNKNRL